MCLLWRHSERGEVNFKLCLHWPFEWLGRLAPSEGQWEGADDITLCWLVGPCASHWLSWARFQMLWFALLKQSLPVEVAYVCSSVLLSWSKKSIQELGFRPITAWEILILLLYFCMLTQPDQLLEKKWCFFRIWQCQPTHPNLQFETGYSITSCSLKWFSESTCHFDYAYSLFVLFPCSLIWENIKEMYIPHSLRLMWYASMF